MPLILAGRSPSEGTASVAEFHDGAEQLAAGYLTNQFAIFNYRTAALALHEHILGYIYNVFIGVSDYKIIGGHMITNDTYVTSVINRSQNGPQTIQFRKDAYKVGVGINHADAGDLVVDDNLHGIHQVVFGVNLDWVE
jgi:hypothetical protein